MSKSKPADEIIRNAVELQSLQLLQNSSESLRDKRLTNSLLRSQAMIQWLKEPNNKDYIEILAKIGGDDLKDDVSKAYTCALDVARKRTKTEGASEPVNDASQEASS